MMEDDLRIGEFIRLLNGSGADSAPLSPSQGGIGSADVYRPPFAYDPEQTLLRKTAARILHDYLRSILAEPDLVDISPASVLRDLYDCRVCVDAIAEVVCKGIMEPVRYPGGLLLFDGSVPVDEALAQSIISRTLHPAQRLIRSSV